MAWCAPCRAGAQTPRFVDVAAEAGICLRNLTGGPEQRYIVESLSGGAAFLDYDGDGDLDAYLVNGSDWRAFPPGGEPRNALYRNQGNGTFADATDQAGVGHTGWGMGAIAPDYDNDGAPDLYVTNWGPNVLYRNKGDGTFADVTGQAGVGDARWGAGCAAADYDNDGDVDLYMVNHVLFDRAHPPNSGEFCTGYRGLKVYCGPRGLPAQADALYRNEGDGTFADVTEAVGIGGIARYGLGAVWTDYDDDGDADIFVAVDSQANLLYRNDGPWPGGRFEEVALTAGVAYSGDGMAQAGMGIAVGDYNRDGRMDLYVTHFSDDNNTLYQNEGTGFFTDVTWTAGLAGVSMPYLSWSAGFTDCDNDGDLDLFVPNGHIFPQVERPDVGLGYAQPNQIFLNQDGRFEDVSDKAGPGLAAVKVSRGAAYGDYDDDGDVDILVVNMNDTPTLLRNDTGGDNRWVKVALEGVSCNRQGIGARVRVVSGDLEQWDEMRCGAGYLSDGDRRLHFGLGAREGVDRVEVRWPGGTVDVVEGAPAGCMVVVREGEGGRVVMLGKKLKIEN